MYEERRRTKRKEQKEKQMLSEIDEHRYQQKIQKEDEKDVFIFVSEAKEEGEE